MAEAIAIAILRNLTSLAAQEIESHYKLASLTIDLREKYEALRGFLRDAEERQEDDKEIRKWMSQLKDVNYEMEHLTEKHLNLIQRRRRMQQRNMGAYFNPYRNMFDESMLRRDASKIHGLTARISRLTAEMRNYGIEFRQIESTGADSIITDAIAGLFSDEDELISGVIDEDLKTMEKELVYGRGTKVLGICGADGLGKTTFARELLKRSIVDAHFEAVAWIYAGDLSQSSVEGVFRKILADLQSDELGEDDERIRRVLGKKRCLVVVDDLQSIEEWDLLASALSITPESSSKLLITTCDPSVLGHVDCGGYLHQSRFLNSEERWQLLQNKTAPLQGIGGYVREDAGKAIVQHCIGLPLTIQVLGGVLAFDTIVPFSYKWQKLYHNLAGGGLLLPFNRFARALLHVPTDGLQALPRIQDIWNLLTSRSRNSSPSAEEPEDTVTEAEVRQVLQLSYAALPSRLRRCLVKMSEHRELGIEVSVSELCNVWIEEGVVTRRRWRSRSAEEVARGCVEELVKRSLIQVVSKEEDERIRTCQLHRLVRDFYTNISNPVQQVACSSGGV